MTARRSGLYLESIVDISIVASAGAGLSEQNLPKFDFSYEPPIAFDETGWAPCGLPAYTTGTTCRGMAKSGQ